MPQTRPRPTVAFHQNPPQAVWINIPLPQVVVRLVLDLSEPRIPTMDKPYKFHANIRLRDSRYNKNIDDHLRGAKSVSGSVLASHNSEGYVSVDFIFNDLRIVGLYPLIPVATAGRKCYLQADVYATTLSDGTDAENSVTVASARSSAFDVYSC
ncbi:hypothetical protein VTK56DRAFT_2995 [Thermocarpiscus australiensis]